RRRAGRRTVAPRALGSCGHPTAERAERRRPDPSPSRRRGALATRGARGRAARTPAPGSIPISKARDARYDGCVRPDLLVRVTADPIGAGEAVGFVSDPAAGGTCVFLGTVRDHSDAGAVMGLTYEALGGEAERRVAEVC